MKIIPFYFFLISIFLCCSPTRTEKIKRETNIFDTITKEIAKESFTYTYDTIVGSNSLIILPVIDTFNNFHLFFNKKHNELLNEINHYCSGEEKNLQVIYHMDYLSNVILSYTRTIYQECTFSPSSSISTKSFVFYNDKDSILILSLISTENLKNKARKDIINNYADCKDYEYYGNEISLIRDGIKISNPLKDKLCNFNLKYPFNENLIEIDIK